MKFIEVKDIVVEIDDRDLNVLERDDDDKSIKFKQSKCTCKIILEDTNGELYTWVAKNEHIAEAIEKIAKNEESKYKVLGEPLKEKEIAEFKSGKFLLGRNLFFLAWVYPLYDWYLTKFGFNPPQEHLEKSQEYKHGKY